mmetsp:Transcript_31244/g.78242  ORF Transcript_31244/g.78242 Transcript_31244/m.78242 type:complete len:240 (-) Transcript_31244:175-894(-)
MLRCADCAVRLSQSPRAARTILSRSRSETWNMSASCCAMCTFSCTTLMNLCDWSVCSARFSVFSPRALLAPTNISSLRDDNLTRSDDIRRRSCKATPEPVALCALSLYTASRCRPNLASTSSRLRNQSSLRWAAFRSAPITSDTESIAMCFSSCWSAKAPSPRRWINVSSCCPFSRTPPAGRSSSKSERSSRIELSCAGCESNSLTVSSRQRDANRICANPSEELGGLSEAPERGMLLT